MRIGFVLSAYDRIDDLLAHLDIIKYFPHQCEVIPIWMKEDVPDYFLEEMGKYPLAHYKNGSNFRIGPLLALASGLRKASEAGLDYVVYRNGDDWLFNHSFCLRNFSALHDEKKHVAAYNWLTNGTMVEFAMNELYVRVANFMKTVDEAEDYFTRSSTKFLCEFKMSRWIKRTIDVDYTEFHRLPDREQDPGVGYERETLPEVFWAMGRAIPLGFWESLVDNNRFFNRKWQLIGSHNNYQRYNYYASIREAVRYAEDLEKQPHFARWLDALLSGGSWNLPHEPNNEPPWRRRPLCLRTEPKKMPRQVLGLGKHL